MAASVRTRNVWPSKSYPGGRNIQGGIVVGGQSIYEQSLTPLFPLEHVIKMGNRTFIYSSAGETLYAGNLCEMAPYGGATTTLQTTQAVTAAAAAGNTRIYVNALTTAQTADTFKDGYISVWDATTTGKCWLFKIKGNSALATSGTTSYVDLYDPLPEALTTDDQCEFIANPYKSVAQHNASQAGCCLGVAPINVTSAYYFWLQTYGPAAVYPEAALDVGEDVVASDNVAGTVCKRASATEGPVVGFAWAIGTAAESSIVFLTIRKE